MLKYKGERVSFFFLCCCGHKLFFQMIDLISLKNKNWLHNFAFILDFLRSTWGQSRLTGLIICMLSLNHILLVAINKLLT